MNCSQLASKQLANKHNNLDRLSLLLVFYVIGNSDYKGKVYLEPKRLSKHFDVTRQQISRSIRMLLDFGIIIPSDRRLEYDINPEYFWKGSGKSHATALRLVQ